VKGEEEVIWKKVFLTSVLILLLLSLNQVTVFSAGYTNVDVSQAKEMIDTDPDLVILDVRTWEEYINGHIKNATLIPVSELEGRLWELDRLKPTLVYCRSGMRSASASQILADHGFIEVYNMLGGILAWIAAGYPVVQIEVPKDYGTIQAAINAADEGDTIFVYSRTYYENVVVNKTISLIGEDKITTVIDANGTDHVVMITWTTNVTLSGFTLRRSGEDWVHTPIWVSWPESGIFVTDSEWCVITDNIVEDNFGGVTLHRSPNNILSCNSIRNNTYGVSLSSSFVESTGNIINENTIINNELGLVYDLNFNYGDTSDNYIYHNNFVNNSLQAASIVEDGSPNFWDDGYPSGGNYWSDYEEIYPNATEIDDSGIWDTPYLIDGNNRDNYPLVEPWFRREYVFNYVFKNERRGVMLKIDTDDKHFQFIAPDKTFSIKHDPNMTEEGYFIGINFQDSEIALYATAIVTDGFCVAIATDLETGTQYWLTDSSNRCWRFSPI